MNDHDTLAVLVTATTLATVLMISLGFRPRPTREAAIWSIAFIAGLGSTYLLVAAEASQAPTLWALAAGTAVGGLGLVWVGVRAFSHRRWAYVVPTVVGALALTTALTALTAVDAPEAATVLALTGATAATGATAVEFAKIRGATRTAATALATGAALCTVYTVVWLVAAVWQLAGSSGAGEATATLATNAPIMIVVYLLTALVTLLLLARTETARRTEAVVPGFDTTARDRLTRAERAGDTWWSLLDVRLDDPAALREASSTLAFARVVDRFAADLFAELPAEADITRIDPTRYLVLLPRNESAVYPLMRSLLGRIATVAEDQSIPVRLSASIGWAGVAAIGYDLDVLAAAAEAAADEAQRAGGDRWERAAAPLPSP